MIDQLTLQTIGILLTGISLTVAATYYILTLRNTRRNQQQQLETRQASLFMQVYSQWNSVEFSKQHQIIMDTEWENYDDHRNKIFGDIESATAWMAVARFFEGIGVLVHRGLVDVMFVDDLMSGTIIRYWEKVAPIIEETRIRLNYPSAAEWVEYLYNQIKPIYDEQHPELKT